MLEQLSNRVYRWVEVHGAALGAPYRWNSYAVHVPEREVLALIDPLAMDERDALALESIRRPSHIVLTCEFHLRESEPYRKRWGSTLLANEVERERYSTTPDGWFRDGDTLLETIGCVLVPGGFFPETALLVQGDPTVLIIGDILSGARCDAGIPDGELGIAFPEYVPDLDSIRRSLERLSGLEFDLLCFGHGEPVRRQPRKKLRKLCESDEVWSRLEELKARRGPKDAG